MKLKGKELLSVWGGGQVIAFSGLDGKTDFSNDFTGRTSVDGAGIDIKTPGECKVKFSDSEPLKTTLAGDFFELQVPEGTVKGAFVDAYHLLVEGPCEVTLEEPVKVFTKGNKTLIGICDRFQEEKIDEDIDDVIARRAEWVSNIDVPELPVDTEKALYKALSMLKSQFYSPQGRIKHYWTTPDRWPHHNMWLWDSVFHAAGLRHLSPALARDAISAVFDAQEADGFVPHCIQLETSSEITQPPVLALGIKLVNETEKDLEWLKELYPKVKAYLEWDMKNRDTDGGGLLEWFIEANENCRSGESGMDNSPRFDAATQLDAVDLNAFIAMEYEILADFAAELGYEDDAKEFTQKHEKLCELMNKFLWNDELNFYCDYDPEVKEQTNVMASSGFLPLLCGAASQEQAEKLLAQLKNPETFATTFPVPSIAACCTEAYSKDMWRGPVWVNINWLIAYGLKRYGFKQDAEALIAKTMDEVKKAYLKHGSFFEFYDDRLELDPPKMPRKSKNAPEISPYHQVIFDFGWSATLFIDMVYSQA